VGIVDIMSRVRAWAVDAASVGTASDRPDRDHLVSGLREGASTTLAALQSLDSDFEALPLVQHIRARLSDGAVGRVLAAAPGGGSGTGAPAWPLRASTVASALRDPGHVGEKGAVLEVLDAAVTAYCRTYQVQGCGVPTCSGGGAGGGGDGGQGGGPIGLPRPSRTTSLLTLSDMGGEEEGLGDTADDVLSLCAPSYEDIRMVATELQLGHPQEVCCVVVGWGEGAGGHWPTPSPLTPHLAADCAGTLLLIVRTGARRSPGQADQVWAWGHPALLRLVGCPGAGGGHGGGPVPAHTSECVVVHVCVCPTQVSVLLYMCAYVYVVAP
jgi:hypothetical protein